MSDKPTGAQLYKRWMRGDLSLTDVIHECNCTECVGTWNGQDAIRKYLKRRDKRRRGK